MKLNGKSKCVVYLEVLSSESIKKIELRHLETNHPGWVRKPIEILSINDSPHAAQQTSMKTSAEVNKPAVHYSIFICCEKDSKKLNSVSSTTQHSEETHCGNVMMFLNRL